MAIKKMKFERKQARQARSMPAPAEPKPAEVMPPPGVPEEPPASIVDEPTPVAEPMRPKPKQPPLEQIAAYVRSFDFGRLRQAASKAISSGIVTEEQVDQAIDAALPSAQEAESLPLGKLMACASVATPEKREEYRPLLMAHLDHAKSLPENEQGEVKDHMALLGFMEQIA